MTKQKLQPHEIYERFRPQETIRHFLSGWGILHHYRYTTKRKDPKTGVEEEVIVDASKLVARDFKKRDAAIFFLKRWIKKGRRFVDLETSILL